ncbi:ABC_transporter family protein [Hexamita inflata]|uniref:ABC transporter family protein n=1 Tax=Hexamita inflata TaxID=28002 RepID=A0AA86N6B2_9EUKA|nr:ABC transporter family protein [Hexamita inflata]CAI9949982.1 ABC transporter family protein [Hexamita inflata]
MNFKAQFKAISSIYFKVLKRQKGMITLLSIMFGVAVFVFLDMTMFGKFFNFSVTPANDDSPTVVSQEIGKYALQYNKSQDIQELPHFMDTHSDYHLVSDSLSSTDTKDMTDYMDEYDVNIGIAVDEFSQNKFVGVFVVSSIFFSLLAAHMQISNKLVYITIIAMPLAAQESASMFGMLQQFTLMISMSFCFVIQAPQSYFFQFAKARIEGRKDVMAFAGLSKLNWHITWNLLTGLLIFAQYLILLIFGIMLGAKFCSIESLLAYIPTLLLVSFQVSLICDILQNFCDTMENYSSLFGIFTSLFFLLPVIALGWFIDRIPKLFLAFLSIIPPFAIMNSVNVGFNIGYYDSRISEAYMSGNYILLQLVLQIIYVVVLSYIAIILDKSLTKSTSKIQPTNVTEPPTEKQKQSSVYGFGVEKMKTQAHDAYININNKEADNKKMLHGDYQEIDYAPETYTTGSQGVLIYNVSKDYKSKKQVIRANKNVNLLINNNEIFGVLGPNGSGKTTLCKAVMMAQTIDSGDIVVNGLSIRSDFKEVQKKIGICLQNDAGLFEELTVTEHLQFYKAICTNPSEIDFLAQFQLEEHKDKRAKELSGGWKRRLSVACALQNNPDILILDEITSGVDAVAREELWKLLKEICRDKTIIATTHTLHEAQTYFDRVAFIMNGQIVCCGKVDDVTNLYKNKICLEVRGLLPKSFFTEMKELGIIVEDNQVVGQRIQMLEAQCQNNVEVLFQHLNEYQEHKVIESFSITQRQFDQVFYELIRVCE